MENKRTLRLIKARFAGREEIIEDLFRTSETFRCLCRDYLACSAILAWWERSDYETARCRAHQFSGMQIRLREDILGWLRGERGRAGFLFRNGDLPRGN
ncbi:MAG: hypothetical protein ACWGSQ_12485 [Longimicrobiales bacterium]